MKYFVSETLSRPSQLHVGVNTTQHTTLQYNTITEEYNIIQYNRTQHNMGI